MNIISPFADQAVVQSIFSHSPELERFAFEFCKEFNCIVEEPVQGASMRSRPYLTLLTSDGLRAGKLQVDPLGDNDKDGKRIPVYFYDSPIVTKSKGSSRAGRTCRDSTSIKALINVVKRNDEIPSHEKLVTAYGAGIRYAFRSIEAGRRAVRLDLNGDEALALVLSYLELDKTMVNLHNESIKQKLMQYQISLEREVNTEATLKRFCNGSYLIGYTQEDHGAPPSYIVGEVSVDFGQDQLTFHAPLKRYKTLMDCPEIAPHVPIVAAWAEGQAFKDPENELRLPRNDRYYPEIDVAGGYASRSEMWYLIPKNPA